MRSIRDVYKIGKGPSSSHTMGPYKAASLFVQAHPEADAFEAILYGSLALTGKGHGTDRVLMEAFAPHEAKVTQIARPGFELPHPNTMDLVAYQGGTEIARQRVMSIGGGDIQFLGGKEEEAPAELYSMNSFSEIAEYCKQHRMRLSDYVEAHEGPGIWDFLREVWNTMCNAVENGLAKRGTLPGGLEVERKAQYLYQQRHIDESPETREDRLICAYAFAVSEENADNGIIVTAPTCGSCGVLPATLVYMHDQRGFSEKRILKALAVGGLIGALVKKNASVSGAECGCQAEIGTACSMTAAALAELFEMGIDQVEYAAEVAMEHHLGLTCDPVGGLVQIPCIERNAVAAMRAVNALRIANFLSATRKVSFDVVVRTMYETGRDLNHCYRETSEGGLAKNFVET